MFTNPVTRTRPPNRIKKKNFNNLINRIYSIDTFSDRELNALYSELLKNFYNRSKRPKTKCRTAAVVSGTNMSVDITTKLGKLKEKINLFQSNYLTCHVNGKIKLFQFE
ncbi:hypothetical protein BpHYR1_014580 [Brachionus plicatilis]|uniref:Uncharacterized protein n=1 Tax=Brachionus plicatilis TaxID=10195 RepID=A0A3M7RMB3_BRAPC|nr:hypothetical protein BpHYR1_014580 [Brachionus plicatilis]